MMTAQEIMALEKGDELDTGKVPMPGVSKQTLKLFVHEVSDGETGRAVTLLLTLFGVALETIKVLVEGEKVRWQTA